MHKFLKRKVKEDVACTSTGSSEDRPKSKIRKYEQSYLNWGFMSLEVRSEERSQCLKVWTADSMKPNKCKKTHSIADQLILPAIKDIVNVILFGKNFGSQISNISLSNDTLCRRNNYISVDIQQQIEPELIEKLFAIQLDEASNSSNDLHLICCLRFCQVSEMCEELLFLQTNTIRTTATKLFKITNVA